MSAKPLLGKRRRSPRVSNNQSQNDSSVKPVEKSEEIKKKKKRKPKKISKSPKSSPVKLNDSNQESFSSLAVTTPFVRQTFEAIFENQIDDSFVDKTYSEDEEENETDNEHNDWSSLEFSINCNKNIFWTSKPFYKDGQRTFYNKVAIDTIQNIIQPGDFLLVNTSSNSSQKSQSIIKLSYIYRKIKGDLIDCEGYFHGQLFLKATETILGDIGNRDEIFLTDICVRNTPLKAIACVVSAEEATDCADWKNLAKKDRISFEEKYYFSKFYNTISGVFCDIPKENKPQNSKDKPYCFSCSRKVDCLNAIIPRAVGNGIETFDTLNGLFWEHEGIEWKNRIYKKGSAILFYENDVVLNGESEGEPEVKPFDVGIIERVVSKSSKSSFPQELYLNTRVMIRPDKSFMENPDEEDINMVIWTNTEITIPFSSVIDQCNLSYSDIIQKTHPPRGNDFYFSHFLANGVLCPVPIAQTDYRHIIDDCEEKKVKPLNCLDVFSGCGALSKGLEEAGVALCLWGVENAPECARAFQLNHSRSVVFEENCNTFLRSALAGDFFSTTGLRMPKPGAVELLCGGPPCQGFSGLNRYTSGDESSLKNSLVITFLSICDYYRPKYIVIENVRDFVKAHKGMILKMTLKCLLEMKYQCAVGILQSGNFGIPQSRRRIIIMAAAPGLKLPDLPKATHIFNGRSNLKIRIDGKTYKTKTNAYQSAPFKACSIRDAMSDLLPIANGAFDKKVKYLTAPLTHFQRIMRPDNSKVCKDHVCKQMNQLNLARICNIPKRALCDWRDLPNIPYQLPSGAILEVLKYKKSRDVKNAVCDCFEGKTCSSNMKQSNTLIPWSVSHTASRNSNWAGVYGRLDWDGVFSTTVTNPEPMGKQGRVLHPDQDRVVSVRECARSQGLPDDFNFFGSLREKHRQIGNAVPLPLATAIGREIKKAVIENEKK